MSSSAGSTLTRRQALGQGLEIGLNHVLSGRPPDELASKLDTFDLVPHQIKAEEILELVRRGFWIAALGRVAGQDYEEVRDELIESSWSDSGATILLGTIPDDARSAGRFACQVGIAMGLRRQDIAADLRSRGAAESDVAAWLSAESKKHARSVRANGFGRIIQGAFLILLAIGLYYLFKGRLWAWGAAAAGLLLIGSGVIRLLLGEEE